eukprot:CAMPEP_0114325156 /NCGR_PEP_ID=MMETSP0059-20121206/28938_1 /TAXON_ID=36894 /ORGANISM="Pyramimonas parkeae, Strain CCMP726" /LENGTH=155 /DNA_ID=CAMNT_0001453839 /DNA_START=310 /DNA_END=777 /DNA_ORIENTATION=+
MTAHAASLPAELSHLGNRASLSQPSTAAPAACGAGVRERQAEVVVVMLHGLMRGEASMRSLARSVHLATGLECISVGYPSSSMSLSELAAVTAQRVRDACGPDAAVFAVKRAPSSAPSPGPRWWTWPPPQSSATPGGLRPLNRVGSLQQRCLFQF